MRTVAVFRRNYLPLSETFISDHLRSLRAFRPVVVCEHETAAAHRIPLKPMVVPGGRVGRLIFERYGFAPTLSYQLRRSKAELIHVHFLLDAVVFLPFLERTKLPVVVTAHGYDATLTDQALRGFPEGRLMLERRERLIRRIDRIICVSDFIRGELIARGYPEEKLITLPLGVDVSDLQSRPHDRPGKGIVAVGRLVEKKGMHKLIEAYALLPDELRATHPLTIIGDGPERSRLDEHARKRSVKVNFTGALPRAEVIQLVSSAAVFCLPSVRAKNGDAEGMGIVIMEALALGVPVAIFADQPMAAMLSENCAGAVAVEGDSASLAEKIHEFLRDKYLAERYSIRGRAFCEKFFNLWTNTSLLECHYQDLLKNGR